ncbi:MAG: hypothetical protein Q4E63_06585 [Prevotellaceae bacterium]|nr:hypothetical protein [Prevotellaceae bacterium]MDO4932293.1 hypothetical protein [Prevotellaceae bacterium]
MSEQKLQNDPVKSPEIQDMIMSYRVGMIAVELSKRLGVTPIEALKRFYESHTCAELHDKETGLYLYGNLYIADEFCMETHKEL